MLWVHEDLHLSSSAARTGSYQLLQLQVAAHPLLSGSPGQDTRHQQHFPSPVFRPFPSGCYYLTTNWPWNVFSFKNPAKETFLRTYNKGAQPPLCQPKLLKILLSIHSLHWVPFRKVLSICSWENEVYATLGKFGLKQRITHQYQKMLSLNISIQYHLSYFFF